MASEPGFTCATCFFYDADGRCRRFPKRYVSHPDFSFWGYPEMYPSDWCGEHMAEIADRDEPVQGAD